MKQCKRLFNKKKLETQNENSKCSWFSSAVMPCLRVIEHEIRENCRMFKKIVDSKYFGHGIMIAILINTSSMGIEHHKQNEKLTEALEVSNVIFTTIFTLEMVMKILADGLFGYLKNFYNVFDASIVFVSIWEIVDESDAGGLSVLRTFRLGINNILVKIRQKLVQKVLAFQQTEKPKFDSDVGFLSKIHPYH